MRWQNACMILIIVMIMVIAKLTILWWSRMRRRVIDNDGYDGGIAGPLNCIA